MNIWLGMMRVIGLAFGEFGRQVHRLEMVVAPVDVALQFACIQFARAVSVGLRTLHHDLPVVQALVM